VRYHGHVNVGEQVRKARQAARLSQRAIAERAGVRQSTVARIEAGHIDPRWTTVARLLDACGHEAVVALRPGAGVDRTVIRELLKLTPRQRIEQAVAAAQSVEPFRRAASQ
jgi:predicted transcriptional regulator